MAHRLDHAAGLHLARRAGGAGADHHAGEVEAHHLQLGGKAGRRRTTASAAALARLRPAPPRRPPSPFAPSASRQALCAAMTGRSASAAFAAAPKPAMPGTFSVPARGAALLAAAVQPARERRARPGDQRADRLAGRPACAPRAPACPRPAPRSRRPILPAACTASTCSQPPAAAHQPRPRRRPAGSRRSRCWPAIRQTSVRRLSPQARAPARPGRRRHPRRPASPRPAAPDALAVSATASCSVAPTMIRSQPAASGALDGQRIGLGAAADEGDRRRPARRPAPRHPPAPARPWPAPRGRRHAPTRDCRLGQRRGHRRRGLGPHLRGRVVVQIDAHAAASADAARRSLPLATSASETLAR